MINYEHPVLNRAKMPMIFPSAHRVIANTITVTFTTYEGVVQNPITESPWLCNGFASSPWWCKGFAWPWWPCKETHVAQKSFWNQKVFLCRERGLNPRPPDPQSSVLTTRPRRCLYGNAKMRLYEYHVSVPEYIWVIWSILEYSWIFLEYSWVSLNILEYSWLLLSILEYFKPFFIRGSLRSQKNLIFKVPVPIFWHTWLASLAKESNFQSACFYFLTYVARFARKRI